MRSILSAGFGCAFTLAAAGACVETTPAPRLNLNSDVRGTNWWVRLHNDRLANVCRQGGEVDVVLLGDSITHYWDHKPYAYETWNEFTNAYKVLNFGYAGDRTQNLLWRVRNGELDDEGALPRPHPSRRTGLPHLA